MVLKQAGAPPNDPKNTWEHFKQKNCFFWGAGPGSGRPALGPGAGPDQEKTKKNGKKIRKMAGQGAG